MSLGRCRFGTTRAPRLRVAVCAVAAGGAILVGCGSGSGTGSGSAPAFLQQVHARAPDIGNYRSDSDLVKLGRAVCNELAAGASREQVADRQAGSSKALPSEDLGAVITAATQTLCPKYALGGTGSSGA